MFLKSLSTPSLSCSSPKKKLEQNSSGKREKGLKKGIIIFLHLLREYTECSFDIITNNFLNGFVLSCKRRSFGF